MRIVLNQAAGSPPLGMATPPLQGHGDVGGGATASLVVVAVKGFGQVEFAPYEAMVFAYALALGLAKWGEMGLPEEARPKPPLIILPGNGTLPKPPTPRPGAG